jgi:hypothetical protein
LIGFKHVPIDEATFYDHLGPIAKHVRARATILHSQSATLIFNLKPQHNVLFVPCYTRANGIAGHTRAAPRDPLGLDLTYCHVESGATTGSTNNEVGDGRDYDDPTYQ